MKTVLSLFLIALVIISCGDKGDPNQPLCQDPCLKDSIKFTGEHELSPYIYVLAADCYGDSLVWSHKKMVNDRKIVLSEYTKRDVNMYKGGVEAFFMDTSYVWLVFNDCLTKRGYQLKLPFDKTAPITSYSSGLNRFDPKFHVAEGLIVYADYNFVFVQDMANGKTEQVKFSDKGIDIDFNDIHKTFDSIYVDRGKAWVKLVGEDAIEKKLSL